MELEISAQSRTALGKLNKKLRETGMIPAVLYGPAFAKASAGKQTTMPLQVSAKEFQKVFKAAGESTLVNLVVEGAGQHKVLIHDVAKHYMKNEPIHVDFYEVDLTKKIHAKIPLEFVGIAPAVKESGGILIKTLSEIEVEALPSDLPHSFEISIETLKIFTDHIRVSDIKVSDKVKILTHAEDIIVSVQPPRTEAELADLEKPTAEAEKAAVESLTAEQEAEKAAKAGEEGEAKPDEKKDDKKEEKKPKADTKPEKK